MRLLALALLLVLLLPSCTLAKGVGTRLCEAEQTVSDVIADAGGFLGPAGAAIATALTAGFSLLCGMTSEVLATPDTLWQEVGGTTDAEVADVEPDTAPVDG